MPSGIYDRHIRLRKDQAVTEVRNYLRQMVNRDSLDYFVGLYERMTLSKVKKELRILADPETYDNPWRLL